MWKFGRIYLTLSLPNVPKTTPFVVQQDIRYNLMSNRQTMQISERAVSPESALFEKAFNCIWQRKSWNNSWSNCLKKKNLFIMKILPFSHTIFKIRQLQNAPDVICNRCKQVKWCIRVVVIYYDAVNRHYRISVVIYYDAVNRHYRISVTLFVALTLPMIKTDKLLNYGK